MSKFESGFGLVVVLPFILFMMSLWDMRLWQDLQEMKFFWKKKNSQPSISVFIKEEPCLLICRPDCVSVAIWRVGGQYVTQPLNKNGCQQQHALKIDHEVTFDVYSLTI